MGEVSYKGHRYPAEIIAHCVWLYHRLPLSFRDVEELMLVRGVIVTYETNRLFASGVHVLTIKPGFVDTPMTAHIKKGGPLWASPEQVAKGIVWAIDRRRDVAYVPGFWRPIMAVIRALPESVFKRLHL